MSRRVLRRIALVVTAISIACETSGLDTARQRLDELVAKAATADEVTARLELGPPMKVVSAQEAEALLPKWNKDSDPDVRATVQGAHQVMVFVPNPGPIIVCLVRLDEARRARGFSCFPN